MTDHELVARVLAGDPSAERALYDAHAGRVWRVVHRITGDADRTADCVQETFIRAFGRLRDFRFESSLGTWIGSIAVSVTLQGLRQAKRRAARELDLETTGADAPVASREADPDLRARMAQAIDGLPEGYRTVFLLHDVEGYTHEEIGRMLGIQDGTSKAQLSRARARLRVALADFAPR